MWLSSLKKCHCSLRFSFLRRNCRYHIMTKVYRTYGVCSLVHPINMLCVELQVLSIQDFLTFQGCINAKIMTVSSFLTPTLIYTLLTATWTNKTHDSQRNPNMWVQLDCYINKTYNWFEHLLIWSILTNTLPQSPVYIDISQCKWADVKIIR